MKKCCSIILSILFAICLLGTLLLSVVRFNFNYSIITKLASEILKPVAKAEVYNDGLFHPDDKVITLAQYEFDASALEDFDFSSIDLTNLDVNEIVQTYLEEAGVDVEPEFIAEVLASPDVSDFVDKYVGEVVDYMTGAKTELEIDPEDVLKVVNKSIDMFEEHTGEVVAIDRTELKQMVTENISVAQENLTATLDTAKEENAEAFEYLKIVNLILSLKVFIACIAVCVLLAGIILLINRNVFVWLKYVCLPCFIDGFILFIAALVAGGIVPGLLQSVLAEYQLPKGIYEGVWTIISKLITQLKIYGVVAAVLGCAGFVLGVTLGKKTTTEVVSQ